MSRLTAISVRALVFLCVVAVPLAARAQDDATKCTDAYSDCTDSCALRFGMVVRDSERLKLAKCVDKCKRVQAECKERFFETRNNALDDGALDKKRERDDDLREDNRRTAIVPDEKPARKQRDPAEDQPKRTATRADELNKDKKTESTTTSSSDDPRYNMKFEEEKKPEPKKQEAAPKQANLDSDVRKEDSEPPRASEPKKSGSTTTSSSEEPKKKKKERALDEWDPEAL